MITLEENAGGRVSLYTHEGVVWEADFKRQEPQNAVPGDFNPDWPALEICCRSRSDRDLRLRVRKSHEMLRASHRLLGVLPLA
jgi:hypothetical protein